MFQSLMQPQSLLLRCYLWVVIPLIILTVFQKILNLLVYVFEIVIS